MEQIETRSHIPSAAALTDAPAIRVVSWNVNRGLQLNGIVEFLSGAAADLVLLQETDVNARRTHHRNIAYEIAQALRMHYVFGCEFEELTQGNHSSPAYHGQATLSRFPILSSRVLRFSQQSGFWHPRWFIPGSRYFQRRLGARMALVTEIAAFSPPLLAYNVHLESRGDDGMRCSQLGDILTDLRQYNCEVPVVIAGDFNFDLSRRPAASLLANASLQSPFDFENGSRRATVTRTRLGRPRTIDWILVRETSPSGDAQLHDAVHASDHYPLSLTLLDPRPK